ncbi:hypothetical protein [Bdellovibrio sp. KM01]|nr:hypothetical protein [Bdellovibrio sp. KM01]QLY25689.1 hypothetical protein HW988_01150 [Bdellovibrio sp. KM01]
MRLVELLKKLARESDAPTTPIQQKLEDWQEKASDQSSKEDIESDESND